MRVTAVGVAAVLLVSACGAESMTDTGPVLKEGSTITADVVIAPTFIDRRTGATRPGALLKGTVSAVVRNGKAVVVAGGGGHGGPMVSSNTMADLPANDSVVAMLLPQLGFTSISTASGAFPNVVAGGPGTDTLVVIDSTLATPVTWQSLTAKGTYGQPVNTTYSRSGQVLLTENRQWNSISGGVTLSRVILNDYNDPNILIRTNIDITRAKVIELTWSGKILDGMKALALVGLSAVLPGVAHAQGGWECVRDAALALGSLANLVYRSSVLIAAGSATAATGGAAAPTVAGALYGYFGAIGWLSLAFVDAGRSCFGSGGGGKKVTVAKT